MTNTDQLREAMRTRVVRAAMKNMTIPQSKIFAYEVEIFTDEYVRALVADAVRAELERIKQQDILLNEDDAEYITIDERIDALKKEGSDE